MKLLFGLIFITLLASCIDNQYLEIYSCKPIADDSVIRGHNTNLFFEEHTKIREIAFRKINLTDDLAKEIDELIVYLEEHGNYDKGVGIYFFALIKGKDTLYSSSDLESWKYKNFVNSYTSKQIKKAIFSTHTSPQ